MTILSPAPASAAAWRSAWHAAHDPVPGVPRYARLAAVTIPFVVLPASVWRIAVVVFLPPEGGAGSGDLPPWLPIEVYVFLLSIFSELIALSAFGLVARWGEVFPAWVPYLRRKRVPLALGVVPACAGAVILTAVTLVGAVNNSRGLNVQGEPLPPEYPLHFRDLEGVISVLMYAPLLLWGPLLAVVTFAYWRRRAFTQAGPGPRAARSRPRRR